MRLKVLVPVSSGGLGPSLPSRACFLSYILVFCLLLVFFLLLSRIPVAFFLLTQTFYSLSGGFWSENWQVVLSTCLLLFILFCFLIKTQVFLLIACFREELFFFFLQSSGKPLHTSQNLNLNTTLGPFQCSKGEPPRYRDYPCRRVRAGSLLLLVTQRGSQFALHTLL